MEQNQDRNNSTNTTPDNSQQSATWNNINNDQSSGLPPLDMYNNNPIIEANKPSKGKMIAIISILLGVVLIAGAGAYFYYNSTQKAKDEENQSAPVAEIEQNNNETDETENTDSEPNEVENDTLPEEENEIIDDGIITEMEAELDELENNEDDDSTNIKGAKDTSFDTIDMELQQVNGL